MLTILSEGIELETVLPDLPNLKIIRRIGGGTNSSVYEAFHKIHKRQMAVKVVPILDSLIARVDRETSALQSLRHPNIVRLYEFHKTSREFVLELEYVDGCTLSQWIEQNKTLLLEPKLWILAELAQALAIAHFDGTIHRDLKPDNVLISKNGDVKLSDFGLAKQPTKLDCDITQPGLIIGSLAYMAPEALNDGESSFSSDIFSFGVIAYELLTGNHPFSQRDVKSLMDTMYNQTQNLRSLSILSARLEGVLLSCLHLNPEKRPHSLWSIYADLMAFLDSTDLLDLCKPLVSINGVEGGFLALALAKKHRKLKEQITFQLNEKNLDKKQLIRLINEFSELFPNDSDIAKNLSLLRDKKNSKKQIFLLPFFILFLSIIILLVFFIPRKIAVQPISELKINVPVTKTNPTLLPISKLPEPLPTFGTLQMRITSDVRVFIDGIRKSSSSLKSLKLSAGPHQILIERDHFLPIEKTILIKKSQVTKIRTSEQDDE